MASCLFDGSASAAWPNLSSSRLASLRTSTTKALQPISMLSSSQMSPASEFSTFMRLPLFAILAVCIAAASPTFALERTTLRASVDGEEIPVYLYLPDGKGPFPLLVMSHGSPRDAADRATFGADVLRKEAEAFVKKGIAVAVPLRRGYGESTHWAESYGTCKEGHYFEAGLQTARDIWAAAKVAAPTRTSIPGASR